MNPTSRAGQFIVWGTDQAAHGPVELPTLVEWIKDERINPDTWLYLGQNQNWLKASEIPELQMFFGPKPVVLANPLADQPSPASMRPGALRRIKILAGLSDTQIERFIGFMETERVPQWKLVVKQGEEGETMYLILEGELRVRTLSGEKETILATLSVGDFFGDVSLFDQGPRSADVVANTDATLLKISATAFQKLAKEAPDVATPFLLAIGKTLTARIRADNRRYENSVRMSRARGR